MSKIVPDTYTVEFGNRVRDSFIQLGQFADKTDFRLEHLEKHLGDAFAEIETLKRAKPKGLTLKKVLVIGGTVYAGMVVGRKLNVRANREKLKKAYSEAATKVQEMAEQAKSGPSTRNPDPTVHVSPEKGQYVDEVLRGTPNAEGRLNH